MWERNVNLVFIVQKWPHGRWSSSNVGLLYSVANIR